MALPEDYVERVYAGVLGKIIGVYLGRPFEGWSYERIIAELGEVNYYVHERLGVPLIVTDDDISGTFTFLRALPDCEYQRDLTPAQIGQSWLNYIVERRTILWWGGMGNSTEHTAYMRLKKGIPAPLSGSIELNGKVVAEQIGSQIFIDGWAMVAPGDPILAADLARRAGSVSCASSGTASGVAPTTQVAPRAPISDSCHKTSGLPEASNPIRTEPALRIGEERGAGGPHPPPGRPPTPKTPLLGPRECSHATRARPSPVSTVER